MKQIVILIIIRKYVLIKGGHINPTKEKTLLDIHLNRMHVA